MSILGYAALTTRRDEGSHRTPPENIPSGIKASLNALAALVPAEVLALHAAILSATTETTGGKTEITEQGTLFWAFVGLVLLSMAIYAGYRYLAKKWDNLDFLRMLIPPLAFIGWTMLQRATAFDAVAPDLADAPRTVVSLFLGVILGLAAVALAYQPDQNPT